MIDGDDFFFFLISSSLSTGAGKLHSKNHAKQILLPFHLASFSDSSRGVSCHCIAL